ncbi:FAD-dependent monooxygenase [Martelella mediterranea]|uniref:FAD-dependent urate hydroxylase n=1 Tax=Martelella mediterranea DSM 17316 TaxID=1122214 RepID=A0A1U9Z3E7_9HYPH|nr:FAD-dependent monooxygenase [Martelella mediterranea]AQZ52223.1 FAD-dependent urate hydroxylase [Martelella mediterranea DSM 17316]
MKSLKIGISGGSLGGLFAAILLRKQGHAISIFERSRSGLVGKGAGLVGQRELLQILRMIGCAHVARVGVVAHERIHFSRTGEIVHRQSTPQTQISWDTLFSSVANRFDGGIYKLGAGVRSVITDGRQADLLFEDGHSDQFDLVIGADGLGSVARATVNPDAYENRYAGYLTWRGLIPESAVPDKAEVLLGRFSFYSEPGEHVLGYLVPGRNGETVAGSRRYNWVWYRKATQENLEAMIAETGKDEWRFSVPRGLVSDARTSEMHDSAFRTLPLPFSSVIVAEESPSIHGIYDYEAEKLVRGRVALLGDSAFVVRPHTAMGVAKAAGDAMALAAALAEASDVDTALDRYERTRMPIGAEIASYGQDLGRGLGF